MSVVVFMGTDTDVGKTYVAERTIEAMRSAGRDVVAVKPVESGCAELEHDRQDGVVLARATGQSAPTAALQRLAAPIAPAMAADLEDVLLAPDRWCEQIRALDADHDFVIVETAGGVLSPMTWTYNALDLALQLSAKAVLVAANRLGTINHVMLTLRAMDSVRLSTLGVALSAPDSPDASSQTNLEVLRRLDPRPMTTIARGGDAKAVAHWIQSA